MSIIFGIIFLSFVLGFSILHVILGIWAYRDALKRGNSKEYAVIVLLALLFFPIMGLIVYLIIRKD